MNRDQRELYTRLTRTQRTPFRLPDTLHLQRLMTGTREDLLERCRQMIEADEAARKGARPPRYGRVTFTRDQRQRIDAGMTRLRRELVALRANEREMDGQWAQPFKRTKATAHPAPLTDWDNE